MTQKNPSWVQFSDEAWGEAVGPSEYDKFLDSLDAPTLPIQSIEPLPDHDAPLLLTWIVEHVAELVEDERRRVIGPHGATFARHAEMQTEVANLDAARRAANGDLRDQISRQHREAKQELDDFESSVRFQTALKHYLEAAGPPFERIAASTPENQAAVVCQQQAAARRKGLKALSRLDNGVVTPVNDKPLDPQVHGEACHTDSARKGRGKSEAGPRLDQIINALESYAASSGQEFDRFAMPGPLGEDYQESGSFHWLCAQIYPRVFRRAKTTFEKHRAGRCALKPYAPKTDFYRQALPHIAPTLRRDANVHQLPKRVIKTA